MSIAQSPGVDGSTPPPPSIRLSWILSLYVTSEKLERVMKATGDPEVELTSEALGVIYDSHGIGGLDLLLQRMDKNIDLGAFHLAWAFKNGSSRDTRSNAISAFLYAAKRMNPSKD